MTLKPMTLKHTPGPWTLNEAGKISGPRGDTVAFAYDADAILIAAAPETAAERDRLKASNADLLEALENITSAAIGMPASHDNLCQSTLDATVIAAQAHAAIAKAQGND